ncbi:MAG: HSP90 family molecular chaperone [Halioglobus sp.]
MVALKLHFSSKSKLTCQCLWNSSTAKKKFGDWSAILFDQALLAESGQLNDPAGFVAKLNKMLVTLA